MIYATPERVGTVEDPESLNCFDQVLGLEERMASGMADRLSSRGTIVTKVTSRSPRLEPVERSCIYPLPTLVCATQDGVS